MHVVEAKNAEIRHAFHFTMWSRSRQKLIGFRPDVHQLVVMNQFLNAATNMKIAIVSHQYQDEKKRFFAFLTLKNSRQ